MKRFLKRSHSGLVIEMVILFFFITLASCMLTLTFTTASRLDYVLADVSLKNKATLNQIGEYFVRAVENAGSFPTGEEATGRAATANDFVSRANKSDFDWMDTETRQFFATRVNEGYRFDCKVRVIRGSLLTGFTKYDSYRKLTVYQNETEQMTVIVRELFGKTASEARANKNKPTYEIIDWSIKDIQADDAYYETESLTLLQKLIMLISELFQWIVNIFR